MNTPARLQPVKDVLVRWKLRARPNGRLQPVERWLRDGGERLRTRDLGLTPSDVVLDFGGYRGDYAAELRRRYGCTVHVFEPVPSFAEDIRHRFAADDGVVLHEAAVGRVDGTTRMFIEADATGAFASGDPVEVRVLSVRTLAHELPGRIALAKVNIEGGEYDLLPALHDAAMLERIDRLFIQFHDLDEGSADQRRTCRELLARRHSCDWDYPFVWESWTRNRVPGGSSVSAG